ncbi:MAG: hypothetical protein M1829_000190 [Trizodia sp. TS-e1964]|nr:MAG: hypothetical protein M1829_000190 [Trizodia sp. TS-e1964]
MRKSPRKRVNNKKTTESGSKTKQQQATPPVSLTPKSEPTESASSHLPLSGTKRKRVLDSKTGTQVDEERSEPRLSSKRRRLPLSRYKITEANISLLGRETGGDAPRLGWSISSRRSVAASGLGTVRSQRSSTATTSYPYKDLAASEIHFDAEPPEDIEAAVAGIINSRITEQRRAEINIISQQFSNSCQDNARAYSGEDDFIDSLRTAIKALGFEHLCIHERADWRGELKPVAPRDLQFSSSFMAVVDQLETEDAPDPPRKRQQPSTGAAYISPTSSATNVSNLPSENDSQGSGTMLPPTIFLRKKDCSSIKAPRPDISMGIKLSTLTAALSSQNLNTIKARQFLPWLQSEMVEQADGSSEPMLISIPVPRARDLTFPFAVVEGKAHSTGKHILAKELSTMRSPRKRIICHRTTTTTTSAHHHHITTVMEELRVPENQSVYLDLDALVRALDDWAVKKKFCFRTVKREATVALFDCAEATELGCEWHCRARLLDDEIWVLSIINSDHTCIGRGVRKHSSSSKREWLDPVVARHLNVTKQTKPDDIQDLLRVRFGENISYKIAQLCRLRLLDEDIGAQRHSFQLLPAYKRHLEASFLGVHIDLLKDMHEALNELREKKAEAAAYLEAQEPEKWAECLFSGCRYGYDTSNIVESLTQVLRLDRELPIIELLDSICHQVMEKRKRHGHTIEDKQAQRVKALLLNDNLSVHADDFRKLPAYLNALKASNKEVYTNLSIRADEETFHRIFTRPHQPVTAFNDSLPFVALDGTFLKTQFRQTLLFAVARDLNNQIHLLA